jgi:hypothetical protein
MSRRRLLEAVILAALMGLGTWFSGWWAILPVAALWQLIRRTEPSWLAGLASLVAWGVLLAANPWFPLGRLAVRLSGMLRLPPGLALLLPLGYAWLLGWSAARLVRAARG